MMDIWPKLEELQEGETAIREWWNLVHMQVKVKLLNISKTTSENVLVEYRQLEQRLSQLYNKKIVKLPFLQEPAK